MRKLLVFVIALAALGWVFKEHVLPRFDFIGGERISAVEERAAELNEGLPRFVSGALELENVRADGRTLVYRYRHLDYTAAEVDKEASRAAIEPALQRSTCAEAASRNLMAKNVRIVHSVRDRDGRPIDSYEVSSGVCERIDRQLGR